MGSLDRRFVYTKDPYRPSDKKSETYDGRVRPPVSPPLSHLEHKKGRPYSITERMVPELMPVLGSQPAGDVSHKPNGRLPLLSARPAVTLATLKKAAANFAAW